MTRAERLRTPAAALFLFVLNGLCFWFVAGLVKGFHVDGFWSAILGALVVSVASWVVTLHSLTEQDFCGKTLKEARAWCLVWLSAPSSG